MADAYHHGNLRAQVLATAAQIVAADGPDALSLRDLARRAGVSHAAPAHHFSDRRGLFTALAAEGFAYLADDLQPSVTRGRFDETAVAYVRFAVAHPGHFAVMFRTDLVDAADPAFADARAGAGALLDAGLAAVPDAVLVIPRADARRAAWALVHGVATLSLAGAFGDADPEALALRCAHQLFRQRRAFTE